jgi:hypothetical protein
MVKILQTIDALLYDVILWFVLIPKTLVKVIIKPTWSDTYVRSELSKDAGERYAAYMPPITFFILTGILPLWALGQITFISADNNIFVKLNKLSLESNILALTLIYISPPLVYSLVILKWKRQHLNRNSLRPFFHTQCLLWAVFYFFSFSALCFYRYWERTGLTPYLFDVDVRMVLYVVIVDIVFIWFIYAEYKIILRELYKPKLRSFGIALLCFIISGLLTRLILKLIEKMYLL